MFVKKNYIGIDFSTSNTQIYVRRYGIVYNEPSLISFDTTYKNVYVGVEAQEAIVNNTDFTIVNPLLESTFDIFLLYFKAILEKIKKRKLIKNLTLLLSFTIELTEEENNLIIALCKLYHIRHVNIVDPIMLMALGNDVDLTTYDPKMLIFIGATMSSLAVMYKDKIKIKEELTYSGNYFDEKIVSYVLYKHDINIEPYEAQELKIKLADLSGEKHEQVRIINTPFYLSSDEIRPLIIEGVDKLVENIKKITDVLSISTLESINNYGIILTGGFSRTCGLEAYLRKNLSLNIKVAKNPTFGVIEGMSKIIKNMVDVESF